MDRDPGPGTGPWTRYITASYNALQAPRAIYRPQTVFREGRHATLPVLIDDSTLSTPWNHWRHLPANTSHWSGYQAPCTLLWLVHFCQTIHKYRYLCSILDEDISIHTHVYMYRICIGTYVHPYRKPYTVPHTIIIVVDRQSHIHYSNRRCTTNICEIYLATLHMIWMPFPLLWRSTDSHSSLLCSCNFTHDDDHRTVS